MTARYTEPAFPLRSSNSASDVLSCKWAIGASGAVGSRTGSKSLTLTRTGAGAYTVQLVDSTGTAAAPAAITHAQVTAWVNDADPSNDTDSHWSKHKLMTDADGNFTVQFVDEAGAVRELPSGAVVSCLMVIANSDV